ncbi:MAG TPA: hypothetical protein VNE60_11110 [Gemmatimonadaceae bacterium]|nr:hypothetical protein [Gemmatimonadaceae bacterium]
MTDSHNAPQSHTGDMKAGFMGLIIGAVCIFAILYGIVRLTNRHFANEKPAAAATQ